MVTIAQPDPKVLVVDKLDIEAARFIGNRLVRNAVMLALEQDLNFACENTFNDWDTSRDQTWTEHAISTIGQAKKWTPSGSLRKKILQRE